MKKFLTMMSFFMVLGACGSSETGQFETTPGPQGPTGQPGAVGPTGAAATPYPVATPTPTPTPTPESAQQQLIDQQNLYRAAVGQEPLTPGLDCNLYTVPTTTTQIVGATLTSLGSFKYLGVFNQPGASTTAGFNVLPATLQPVVQTWFILKCTGVLAVTDNKWHVFDVNSDDGSNLYIDGLLINNDGQHAATDKSAVKFLSYGVHSFELDFFQATGSQELILNEDGTVMPSTGFFH